MNKIAAGFCASLTAVFCLAFPSDVSAQGFGLGGQRNSANCPNDAAAFNERYADKGAYALSPDKSRILLTFDQGYENGFTATILDTLAEKNVKAVFFLTGDYAKREKELVRRMLDEGHSIGNHSMTHPNFSGLTAEKMKQEIMALHDFVADEYGYEMQYFRFPCGDYSDEALGVVSDCGYKTLFWSFAYVDWLTDSQPSVAEGLDKTISSAHGGAIYLLHSVSETNSRILGEIIDSLRGKGYIL